jgi:predicted nucleotidyltransferase
LSSSVLRWPDVGEVDRAVRSWAAAAAQARPEVVRIGYFGSYARGDWGVGSDLDLIAIVERNDLTFARRTAGLDVTALPVPADLLIYTEEEWKTLKAKGRFGQMLATETVWVYSRESS